MPELPISVLKTLEKLKKAHKHSVSVAFIGGGYYAYEVTKISNNKGRRTSRSLYLGKISEDGTFTEARHRKEETRAKSLEELLKKKKEERKNPLEQLIHPDSIDLKILELISTDGRISTSEIARQAGISASAAKYRLQKLEKRYGIRYTLEFGYSFFGFYRYAIFVKFFDNKPDSTMLKNVFDKEPTIQYVGLLKGTYDLFMYILAETPLLLEHKIYDLRSNSILTNYKSTWHINYIINSYGYLPMRNQFFEFLKNKIWRKTRETPSKNKDQLSEREYLILKELNDNGRQDFVKLDKKYNFNNGISQYTYHSLIKRKIIYRITITMKNLPVNYFLISRCNQIDIKQFNNNRYSYLTDVIQATDTPINKYVIIGDISSPYGLLFISPVLNDYGIGNIEAHLKTIITGSIHKSFVITETLIGELGLRKLDNTQSAQYKLLTPYKEGAITAHAFNE